MYRNTPKRGFHGAAFLVGFTALTAYGIYRHIGIKKEQRYREMHDFAQRYERAYLVQARNRITTEREKAVILDEEREVMAHIPGWTAGKGPYYTQPQIPRIVFKPNYSASA